MKKHGTDPKVKKTLIRNYEQKMLSKQTEMIHGVKATTSKTSPCKNLSSTNANALSIPSLCSSELLANYLTDVTKRLPPPLAIKDLNIDKEQLSAKMTRKLNFNFNEKMYKNLVELNAGAEKLETKKDKRPAKISIKKDMEPNIDDFCDDEKEKDLCPTIPIPNCKFKPVKKVETGQLHKLIASFEKL